MKQSWSKAKKKLRALLILFLKGFGLGPWVSPFFAYGNRENWFPKRFWARMAGVAYDLYDPKLPSQIIRLKISPKDSMLLELNLEETFTRTIYFCGLHEPHVTEFLCQRLKDPKVKVVYDIGSNIGLHAIAEAILLKGRGSVETFEPVPWIREILSTNVDLNELSNIRIHPYCVGSSTGSVELFLPHGLGRFSTNATFVPDLARTFHNLYGTAGANLESTIVPMIYLDNMIHQKKIEPPDLVRIDTEGAELDAFLGMTETFKTHSPDLVFELLPFKIEEMKQFLKNHGYETYHIVSGGRLEKKDLAWFPDGKWDWYATKRNKGL